MHICGMSQRGQLSTELIIARGGDIEAVDTYGYRPLHRMASNNLAVGAAALLAAGAQADSPTTRGETPMSIATMSDARTVLAVLKGGSGGGARPIEGGIPYF